MSIFDHFRHLQLSSSQHLALEKLEAFLESNSDVFILSGYAGSGKTTILKGLVEYLTSLEKKYMLMAPTGRAAKVIREKTGKEAYTVHKSIYSYKDLVEVEDGESFYYYYKIRNNEDVHNNIFIVDEASMLSDAESEGEFFRFGTGYLLTDLFTYARIKSETANTKIIFVGDPCQLSPVNEKSSKAFDTAYLQQKFGVSIDEAEMKEVKRQGDDSGILNVAAKIRKSISSGFFNDFNLTGNGKDIFNPSHENFLHSWEQAARPKIIVTYKNKTALDLNLQIRERKYGDRNLPLQKGDIVIMGGNNYRKGIFNGEFAVVNDAAAVTITRTIGLRGQSPVTLTWRVVELVFPDAENNNKIVCGKMLENFLYGDNFLQPSETQALYVDFCMRHKDLKQGSEEFKQAIINDEYFNCLRLKFGYAVTCHKAQGGEWENVFTVWDHDNTNGFDCFQDAQRRSGKTNEGFYRWAYTAITRASGKLFALNPPHFNSYSSMTFLDAVVIDALNELTAAQYAAEEISLDDELLHQLRQFGLLEQPVQLQDHFIKVRHCVRGQYIEITGWQKKNSEVFYFFKREGETAALKTWLNKDLVFNGRYQAIPSTTNSDSLLKAVESLVKVLPNVSIKRNTTESIFTKIEFDLEVEEKLPFTKNLFDDLNAALGKTEIVIDELEHQPFRERYTFKRGTEEAVIDFEYNGNGFFGRVVPLRRTNSTTLLHDIQAVLQTFKHAEYAG
jgi:tRNA A37 threonylcarbamoyladenosine biosynthesis protein TsaE